MILIGWCCVVVSDIMNFWHNCDSVRQNKDPRQCLKYLPTTHTHTHTHTHRSCKESRSKTHTWGDARNADKRVWISNPVVRGQGRHVYINREFEIWIQDLFWNWTWPKMWSELQGLCLFSAVCLTLLWCMVTRLLPTCLSWPHQRTCLSGWLVKQDSLHKDTIFIIPAPAGLVVPHIHVQTSCLSHEGCACLS